MVPTTTPSAELVGAAKAGDEAAFGSLVDRYSDATYRYALALLRDPGLAEDAAQDAFIDAFLHLADLREDAAFPAWLRRILLKHVYPDVCNEEFAELLVAWKPRPMVGFNRWRTHSTRETRQDGRVLTAASGA